MGNILHSNAKTTPRIREEIQNSKESLVKIAKKYGISVKTVSKWKRNISIQDKPSGPKIARSSLSSLEQNIICEFRRTTKFSLDKIFISLKDQIPSLTRSNLHRVLQKNNLSVLPKEEKPERKKFKEYPIGYILFSL